jgi:hypothetical protein
MKYIFILLTFITFSYSQNLLYIEQENNQAIYTFCIDDNYYYANNRIYFTDLSDNQTKYISNSYLQNIVIQKGYVFENGKCFINQEDYYGLSAEQYNYLMSFLGILWGFLIALSLIISI